ncbi:MULTISPECIES: response regulator [Planococcus]|uniref:Two-component system response regulator n=1 Tax=Planococcus faecalis TaxID=1598147 RepID=A0ABN4XRA8_9BACL|nr:MULTISPECIES: response regulator [Planococcus]AQU80323.1 two-component system response regulator [Planococcus faecalis]MDJ0330382.1 response regulator [Planococcus sp. S3-L1]OHX55058.1 two-component system response regulator [Planococcus faecalis]
MKTILIVDDQLGIRLLLKEVFSKEGYQAIAAGNGIEALKKVQEFSPDLVLLDMKIPGMDGIEILKRLKKTNPRIHVIMMTAYGELDLIKESMNWGAERYFTKPFDVFEVRDAVKQLLEQ